jgi:hypothetical protein
MTNPVRRRKGWRYTGKMPGTGKVSMATCPDGSIVVAQTDAPPHIIKPDGSLNVISMSENVGKIPTNSMMTSAHSRDIGKAGV